METKDIIVGFLSVVWVLGWAIPLLCGLGDTLMSVWFRRDKKKWFNKSMYFMWQEKKQQDEGLILICFFAGNVVLSGVVLILLGSVLCNVPLTVVLEVCLYIGSVIGIIYIPRFIIDLCKATKYDKNTGKLMRLEELEEQQRLLAETIDMIKGEKK